MKKLFFILSVILIFQSALFAEIASVTVVEVNGKAEVSYVAGVWLPLKVGMNLNEKDMIRTGAKSSVRLKYDDNKFSIIDENAEMRFETLKSETADSKNKKKKPETVQNINLKVMKGSVFSKVKNLSKKSDFSVNTPSSVCGVRGTSFEVAQYDEAQISVLEGNVEVFNPEFPDKTVSVGSGSRTSVGLRSAPSAPKAIPASELQKMQKLEQVIFKKVTLPVQPLIVDQSSKTAGEEGIVKTVEYSVKIKNITADVYNVYLLILNAEGEPVDSILMNLVSGGDKIEDVKTFGAKYTFSTPGKYSHRYKVAKK